MYANHTKLFLLKLHMLGSPFDIKWHEYINIQHTSFSIAFETQFHLIFLSCAFITDYRLNFACQCSYGDNVCHVNSVAHGMGDFNKILEKYFKNDFGDWWLRCRLWNCPQMNTTGFYWWWVNVGSGNGLVPSGIKPLPELILIKPP